MAAATMCQSPFHRPHGKEQESDKKKKEYAVKGSDHFALYKAYKGWCEARKARGSIWHWCRSHFIDNQRMETIHKSAQDLKKTAQNLFLHHHHKNADINFEANSNVEGIIKVCLTAGMFPRVAFIGTDEIIRYGPKAKKVLVHPSSCNSRARTPQFLLYQQIFKAPTGKVYLRETTVVSAVPLILFSSQCETQEDLLNVKLDNGIMVKCTPRQLAIIRAFRAHLDTLFDDPKGGAVFKSQALKEFENVLRQREVNKK
jgi:ATP-dependent RNA helicase DHX57